MAEPSDPEDRHAALHAYEHAREAGTSVRHRVDVIDEPVLDYGAPRRPRPAVAARDWPQPTSRTIDHRFADPTATAFKVGFGFAAGTWLFRLAVLIAVGSIVVLLSAAAVVSVLQ